MGYQGVMYCPSCSPHKWPMQRYHTATSVEGQYYRYECPNCHYLTEGHLEPWVPPVQRPDREILHMQTAFLWAQRSLCSLTDRKIGAVITSWDLKRIISIGYNGPGPGLPDDYCQQQGRSNPPEQSRCSCLHAEDNACSLAGASGGDKAMFVTMAPCVVCAQRMARVKVRRVFYSIPYRDEKGLDLLKQMRIGVNTIPVDDVLIPAPFPLTSEAMSLRWTSKPVALVPITAAVSFVGPT